MSINNFALHELHKGVTFGFYARNGYYASEQARKEVERMALDGVNWVVLVVTVMQEGFSATRQFRDFEHTPNDIELKEIIDFIHAKGMHVQLRPMLECYDGKGRLAVFFPPDGERMPGLASTYCRDWFDSMEKRSVYYARLAELTHCEMFCLDSELDRIVCFGKQWKSVLAKVREVYGGLVTSCHTIHTGVLDFEAELADRNHWWYDLDMLSISDYTPCASQPGLSADEMARGMEPQRAKLRRIASLYGKPIVFGECGCTSACGGAMNPSGWKKNAAYDGEEQANYYEALFQT
ncbi:MAG: glycoside hydrolase family 113, partial [Eubacteriales bacterium]